MNLWFEKLQISQQKDRQIYQSMKTQIISKIEKSPSWYATIQLWNSLNLTFVHLPWKMKSTTFSLPMPEIDSVSYVNWTEIGFRFSLCWCLMWDWLNWFINFHVETMKRVYEAVHFTNESLSLRYAVELEFVKQIHRWDVKQHNYKSICLHYDSLFSRNSAEVKEIFFLSSLP